MSDEAVSAPDGADVLTLIGKRIVVADDDVHSRTIVETVLSRAGLIVTLATDGREAIEAVLREAPDLVLLDINMPVVDGLSAAEGIFRHHPVCIVMLSSLDFRAYRERARQAGVSGFLIKPVKTSLLVPDLLIAYREFQRNHAAGKT